MRDKLQGQCKNIKDSLRNFSVVYMSMTLLQKQGKINHCADKFNLVFQQLNLNVDAGKKNVYEERKI